MPRILTDAAPAPAALAAFLLGIERRGALFAQLQCGDAITGDRALAAAMRAIGTSADQTPAAGWSQRFWTLLLASPQLRRPPHAPHWPADLAPALAELGSGPRAALLLRLLGGLPEAEAAAVLGIARQTYRVALQRAFPHRADGSADAAAMRKLGEALQQALRPLPAARLAHLAQLREATIHGRKPEPRLPPRGRWPEAARPQGMTRMLWAGLALCALAFAATFLLPAELRPRDREPRILVAALGPADPPAATFDAETGLLTHRDFELLGAAGETIARDLGFHAWYAAELAAERATDAPEPLLLPDAAHPLATAEADGTPHDRNESDDAPR